MWNEAKHGRNGGLETALNCTWEEFKMWPSREFHLPCSPLIVVVYQMVTGSSFVHCFSSIYCCITFIYICWTQRITWTSSVFEQVSQMYLHNKYLLKTSNCIFPQTSLKSKDLMTQSKNFFTALVHGGSEAFFCCPEPSQTHSYPVKWYWWANGEFQVIRLHCMKSSFTKSFVRNNFC